MCVIQTSRRYMSLRCHLEDIIAFYPNVLNLRVLFPIVSDLEDKRGLLGKLRHFAFVEAAENSCTFLEDLCPTIPQLVRANIVGNLNFANPGLVSYADVVNRLRESYLKGGACGNETAVALPAVIPASETDPRCRGSIRLDTKRLEDVVRSTYEAWSSSGAHHSKSHEAVQSVRSANECLDAVFEEFGIMHGSDDQDRCLKVEASANANDAPVIVAPLKQ